ncbi:MAG: glycosyltransferase [Candidatus Nitrosothermus koennekii]|nr:MAG: glycosyltransferase [Candidatus Nitrosothermus koennekii]
MRILIFHPHLDIKGGSERLTKVFAEEAKRLGHDVKILTFVADKEWFPDADIIKQDELRKKAELFNADLTLLTIPESMYVKSLKGRGKLVMYVHFPVEEEVDEYNFDDYKKRGRALYVSLDDLKDVDLLLTNSKRSALAIRNVWGIEPKVVHPPLDKRFIDTKNREDIPENKILYIARFTPLKRQDFLVLALKIIREHIKDAELILAGFRDYRHENYFKHVKSISDNNVKIIESPTDNEIMRLYNEAKVYAHPRIGEHFGISPCEAMALGVPVVIRAPTGLSEITDKFIEVSDWSFIERLKQVLLMDKEWLNVSREVKNKVKICYPEEFTKRIIRFYEEL